MSERYTQRFACIYDNKESRYVDIPNVSAVLNDRDRLAAEVATLREALRIASEVLLQAGVDVDQELTQRRNRIDAALATSGETP